MCITVYIITPAFTSRIFLVEKSSGGHRVIIDLSSLNTHIHCPTFRMTTVAKLRNCIPKETWFTSIDLSGTFHLIPIHPRFKKFLPFTFKTDLYFFQAMPFSINISPLIFTLVATDVLKLLHSLEGLIFSLHRRLAPLEPRLQHPDHKYKEGLAHLGLTVNKKKSISLSSFSSPIWESIGPEGTTHSFPDMPTQTRQGVYLYALFQSLWSPRKPSKNS